MKTPPSDRRGRRSGYGLMLVVLSALPPGRLDQRQLPEDRDRDADRDGAALAGFAARDAPSQSGRRGPGSHVLGSAERRRQHPEPPGVPPDPALPGPSRPDGSPVLRERAGVRRPGPSGCPRRYRLDRPGRAFTVTVIPARTSALRTVSAMTPDDTQAGPPSAGNRPTDAGATCRSGIRGGCGGGG